ncbi:MAG: phytoene desaturase [Bacteroidetes bacterium]|nr:MAG: phytoene desaturase [Bacteroidota bacterium]TAG88831.1 MAG: phytoene desaturase [Bacteroidota bacterium]
MTSHAHIIGAGIAGIAAAIRLKSKGHHVEVWETNDFFGGKLSEFSLGKYRFDAGPSLFTMPQMIEELFVLAKKNIHDYFEYKTLETACHYFYDDGTILHAYTDIEKFAQEIETKTKDKATTLKKYLEKSKKKYEITNQVFLEQSLHKVKNFLNIPTLKGIIGMGKLDIFKSLNQLNEKSFEDEKMVQFFNRYATYNGSNPYQTSGIMSIIPHFEFGFGTFFPLKGMVSITESLVKLAKDIGVVFHLNHQVEKIVLDNSNKKVIGLNIKNIKNNAIEAYKADIIVSNMDIVGTYRKLLPQIKAPQKLLTQEKSSSGIIFYWGIKQQFSQLNVHNIFFANDYKKEFDCIFNQKILSDDLTIYINITAKEKKDDAPEQSENWFVMVNAPNNSGQNWDEIIQKTKKNVLQKLSKLLHQNIENLIEEETIFDPRTIELRTSSTQGALYGNSSNNKYAAFLRHANFSNQIKNLYFCGGSVHPGGGIPLCLLSAKIAADCV